MISPLVTLIVTGVVLLLGMGVMFYLTRSQGLQNTNAGTAGTGSKTGAMDYTKALKMTSPRELIPLQSIENGVYRAYNRCYMICRLEGTNFSVLSDAETNARESAVIDILNRIDYPVQFITTTTVADLSPLIEQNRQRAASLPENSRLRMYIELYNQQLENMKYNREILTQVSWMVMSCPDNPEDLRRMRERIDYLVMALRERAGIMLTPVTDFEQILDSIHEIILPEEIVRPSQMLVSGVTEPVHFSAGEINRYLEKGADANG